MGAAHLIQNEGEEGGAKGHCNSGDSAGEREAEGSE